MLVPDVAKAQVRGSWMPRMIWIICHIAFSLYKDEPWKEQRITDGSRGQLSGFLFAD
jgi:hypothetical protein